MTTLMRRISDVERGLEPYEILFKNFFDTNTFFSPLVDSKPKYPIDIYESGNSLNFDIAIVGLSENDINIEVVDGDILRVSYEKESTEDWEAQEYIHQGIAKRSFNFGWKISNKYDLENIKAEVENGLLSISIPQAKEAEPKRIEIKPKKALKAKK